MSFVVRSAETGDADVVARLIEELGYPTGSAEARDRIRRLRDDRDTGVFVAVAGESAGEVVGVAAYDLIWTLHRTPPLCRITTLAIDAGHQRRGVGRALIDAIESVAAERGCFRLEVTPRPGQRDVLAFYTALGFEDRPYRLGKTPTAAEDPSTLWGDDAARPRP